MLLLDLRKGISQGSDIPCILGRDLHIHSLSKRKKILCYDMRGYKS
jgi:hypothetical protein